MAEFGNAAMQGFQTGFQSRGPSALGVFLDTLTDRMTKLQELRAKSQADVYTSQQSQLAQIPGKVQEAGLIEQAKSAYDPEARAKQEAYQYVNKATVPPTPEGGYNPQEMEAGIPGQVQEAAQGRRMQMFQQSGLLPRPQKSLDEISAEAEARGAGYRAGAPRPISSHQADVISGLQGSLASVSEMEEFLRQNPDFQTGLAHPSLRRDVLGTGNRAFADPSTTSFAQISFRNQDAYRRVVTGAQGGFREISDYIPSALPDPATMGRDQLVGSMETFKLETRRAIEQSKRILRLQGYSEDYINELYTQLPTFGQLKGTQPQFLQPGASASSVGNRIGRFQVEME